MIVIKEVKCGNKSVFHRIYTNNVGTVIVKDIVNFRVYKTSSDNFDEFILYDDNMVVVSEVYRYVNMHMASQSSNSREKAIYAIRLLYCFIELTKAKITALSKDDIEKLKYFLLGYSPNKGAFSLQLVTSRSNSTVDGYLNIYRSYFKYVKIPCAYLFEQKESTLIGINPYNERPTKVMAYSTNLKTGTPVHRVPRYISVDAFRTIIAIIREDGNMLAECIVRLMYQFGLRIGEVLGLTFEDVTELEVDNMLCPVLLIRNRLSDKYFQKAKTCMNIVDINQYRSKDYWQENLSYQKVIITYEIFELLNNYIEKFHSVARNKNFPRYIASLKADKTSRDKYADDNYYIFINSIGKRLSEQSWNDYIRGVYKKAGIPIDKESKKTNLNHRLRHGFAMFQVQYRKINVLELQKLMRHAVLSSTMVYFNPTESDEAKIKNEFVNELYDLIPELKGNIYEK